MIWVVKVTVKDDPKRRGWLVLDKLKKGFLEDEGDGEAVLERHGLKHWETFEIADIEVNALAYDSMISQSDLLKNGDKRAGE